MKIFFTFTIDELLFDRTTAVFHANVRPPTKALDCVLTDVDSNFCDVRFSDTVRSKNLGA